jgi:hypothetical protein
VTGPGMLDETPPLIYMESLSGPKLFVAREVN